MLDSVQRGGHHGFGTLHSLVFRHEPWCFELRIATWDNERGIVPATASSRRFALSREQVFADTARARPAGERAPSAGAARDR